MIWVWLCQLSPRTRRLAIIWTKWAPCPAAVIFIAVSAAEAWSRLDLITTPHPSPSCESRLAKLNRARRWASHTLPRSAPPRPSAQPAYTWPHCQTAFASFLVSFSLPPPQFFFPALLIHFIEPLIEFFYCHSCYPKACCSVFKVLWWFMYKGLLRTHAHTHETEQLMPGTLVALRDAQLDWQKHCLLFFPDWHALAYELGSLVVEAGRVSPAKFTLWCFHSHAAPFKLFSEHLFVLAHLRPLIQVETLQKVKRPGLLPNLKTLIFCKAVRVNVISFPPSILTSPLLFF